MTQWTPEDGVRRGPGPGSDRTTNVIAVVILVVFFTLVIVAAGLFASFMREDPFEPDWDDDDVVVGENHISGQQRMTWGELDNKYDSHTFTIESDSSLEIESGKKSPEGKGYSFHGEGPNSSLSIQGCGDSGMGLSVYDMTLTLTGCDFGDNYVKIYSSAIQVEDCTLGDGQFMTSNCRGELSSCTFTGPGSWDIYTNGVSFVGSTIEMDDCIVSAYNRGIKVSDDSLVNITRCEVNDCDDGVDYTNSGGEISYCSITDSDRPLDLNDKSAYGPRSSNHTAYVHNNSITDGYVNIYLTAMSARIEHNNLSVIGRIGYTGNLYGDGNSLHIYESDGIPWVYVNYNIITRASLRFERDNVTHDLGHNYFDRPEMVPNENSTDWAPLLEEPPAVGV